MSTEIKRAKAKRSKIHGTGLFATEDVPKGEKIIEYTGERITKAEAVRRYEKQSEEGAIYLFDLNKRHDIDGAVAGNEAKYANHSCEPNAETTIERGRIWVLAKRPIKKGEEILYDYNFPLFDHEKRPCHCGSAKCRGWIISKSAYYYKRRKEAEKAGKRRAKAAKKAVKKAAKKPAEAATRSAKKSAKTPTKAAKKATKKSAKATKKTVNRPTKAAKKSTKKPAKRASRSTKRSPRTEARPSPHVNGSTRTLPPLMEPDQQREALARATSHNGGSRIGRQEAALDPPAQHRVRTLR